ncbi:Zn-ribbon domain-containing OB-fold protein [Halostella pelagica]|uniref:Zn-ribbon domain-containing OB-fold protein n=1 Tax=Halostella pelagica TaxID=2583824 RepID=UPI0010805611|nr:OB-fold domain-containing protein [Halostella pelagica]
MSESLDDYRSDGRLTTDGWRAALEDGVLLGQTCADCEHVTAAPKAACARCGSRDLSTVQLPEEGTVYSVSRIEVAPAGFDAPYHVGLVTLGDARLTARLSDAAEIGDSVSFQDAVTTPEGPAPRFG